MSSHESEYRSARNNQAHPVTSYEVPTVPFEAMDPADIGVVQTNLYESTEEANTEALNAYAEDSETGVVELSDRIDQSSIEANALRDNYIRDLYNESDKVADQLVAKSISKRESVVNDARTRIQEAEDRYERWLVQEKEALEMTIEALRQQHKRNVFSQKSALIGTIEINEEAIEEAEVRFAQASNAVNLIKSEAAHGLRMLEKHEKRRDAARDTYNYLVEEFADLKQKIENYSATIDKYTDEIYELDVDHKELLAKSRKLRSEDRKERAELAAPQENELKAYYGIVDGDSDNNPPAIQEAIQNLRATVRSDATDRIAANLKANADDIKSNRLYAETSQKILDAEENKKAKAEEELALLPPQIEVALSEYQRQVEVVAATINHNSEAAARIAANMSQMVEGDITLVARNAIPVELMPFYEATVKTHTAVARVAGKQLELPTPRFDAPIIMTIHETDIEPYTAADLTAYAQAQKTIQEQVPQPIDIIGNVKRSLRKAGATVFYKVMQEENNEQ